MTGPFALFVPEDTVYGTVYHPANRIATDMAALADVRAIPEDRLPYIRSLGFDERFRRLWRFYLGYCEAGFRTERTNVVQLSLAKS